MSYLLHSKYKSVWLIDFEFSSLNGARPDVRCMVARELYSGEKIQLWRDELDTLKEAPFDVGEGALVVAYYASAEIGCFRALNWQFPRNLLDLFTEFRCLTNGRILPGGKGLIGALQFYGLPSIDAAEKDIMRDLALRGGDYTDLEKTALIDYCESDVLSLEKLIKCMENRIDLPRALLRGKYMAAVAEIEWNGIPIDVESFNKLKSHWQEMQTLLIERVDKEYGVYEGSVFKMGRFENYLSANNIPWPRLPTGKLDLRDDTFKDMASLYPKISQLRELRNTLGQMRLSDLPIGPDGRNRCLLSAFSSITSRNQPSTSKFIYGPAVWMRHLIRPAPGYGIAYIDWSQQEFGIAAALSNDPLMRKAYESGDPYLEFAKQAGAVPDDATKQSHKLEREKFKACVLAVQYGMGAESLARRINLPPIDAQVLLDLHRRTYRVFWEWSEGAVNYAALNGFLYTAFGWNLIITCQAKERTSRNFPMQANGAEMLRFACIYGLEAGVKICAPVHDAVLIEAPLEVLDEHIALMQEAMKKASQVVLGGFSLRSGVEKFCYPDRYSDERGVSMWETISTILAEVTCDKVS